MQLFNPGNCQVLITSGFFKRGFTIRVLLSKHVLAHCLEDGLSYPSLRLSFPEREKLAGPYIIPSSHQPFPGN